MASQAMIWQTRKSRKTRKNQNIGMMLFNHDQSLVRSLVFAGFYWFGTIGQVRERANQKIQKNQKNQEFGKIIFDHDQSLLRSLVFTGFYWFGTIWPVREMARAGLSGRCEDADAYDGR